VELLAHALELRVAQLEPGEPRDVEHLLPGDHWSWGREAATLRGWPETRRDPAAFLMSLSNPSEFLELGVLERELFPPDGGEADRDERVGAAPLDADHEPLAPAAVADARADLEGQVVVARVGERRLRLWRRPRLGAARGAEEGDVLLDPGVVLGRGDQLLQVLEPRLGLRGAFLSQVFTIPARVEDLVDEGGQRRLLPFGHETGDQRDELLERAPGLARDVGRR